MTFRKKLVNFSYHWYSKPSLNYPFSTVWIFPVLLTLNYFCMDIYSNFPNYLLRNFTNILFISVTLYLILSQCFLCLFLCSFPINTVAFYHLEFCLFHYVLWGEGGKTDQNMVYILYFFLEHFHSTWNLCYVFKEQGPLICHGYLFKPYEIKQDSKVIEWSFYCSCPFKDCVNSLVQCGL